MKKHFKRKFILIIFIIILMFLLISVISVPAMESFIRARLRFSATEIILNAIWEKFDCNEEILENAITIQKADNGKVTSIVANSFLFSILKQKITQNLLDDFSDIRLCKTELPIFMDLFPENPPTVPFRFRTIGVPSAEIRGLLSSSGLNQSHYQVLLSYSVEISALFPFSFITETVSDEIILTEIVFSGDIPNVIWNR